MTMLGNDRGVLSILPHPKAPATVEEAGLSLDLILQLTLKTLHFSGELNGVDLAQRLGVRFSVVEPALQMLKAQHQVEIVGGAILGGPAYRYRITDAGRTRAALFLESSHYVGAAPVPLAQYRAYMNEFKKKAPHTATRERVRAAFSHLVISERGWLREMRLCYDRAFRPAACDRRRLGPADSASVKIWRGL